MMKPPDSTAATPRVASLPEDLQELRAQYEQLVEQYQTLQDRYSLKKQDFSESLQHSEQRFQSTFEQAAVGIAHAAMNGHFLRLNQRFCDIVGYTQTEIQAHTFQDLTHPDDLDSDLVYVRELLAGERQTYSMEKRYIRKDGSIVWVNLTVSLARHLASEPGYFIKVIEDISQRKQAEEALRMSEEQYRLLANRVADGIGILQDGRFVFVNEALAAMLGVAVAELLGQSAHGFFQSDDPTTFEQGFAPASQKTAAMTDSPVLQYVITHDKREIWMEGRYGGFTWQGRPAVLVDVRDITSRKRREMEMAAERNILRRENRQLRATMKERYRFGDIIGKSPAMQQVYEMLIKAAVSDQAALIRGESGTGKELAARTIHQLSHRQKKYFVPVNCGAIPEALFEREFFGHKKGAFTGADRDKQGFFDIAHHGTLFLDEVGELTPSMQVKLLRAIETGEYTPIGEHTPRRTDVRIVAATNRDLSWLVSQNLMREDFFYRIHVIVITIPPLRERKEDIPLLIEYLLKRTSEGHTLPTLPGHILEALYSYDWPGNIRQLQNTLSRYLTVGNLDFIAPAASEPPKDVVRGVQTRPLSEPPLTEEIERLELQRIRQALERHHWHRGKTAQELQIPRRSLFRKMKKYGLI